MQERLQKIIARAGIASRRHAELLIQAGAVTVNGHIVSELGSKADPENDAIKVRGKLLRFPAAKEYLMLHKPPGCVAALSDPEGRETLKEHLQGFRGRVYPVGGMEFNATGMVLLTSDGGLANALLRELPRLPQTWWMKVKGQLDDDQRREAQNAANARIRLQKAVENSWYEVTLPGRGLEPLRERLARLGHPVEKMKRVAMGDLELGTLPPRRWRRLEPGEMALLTRAARHASGGVPLGGPPVATPARGRRGSAGGERFRPRQRTRHSRGKRRIG